MYCEFYQLQERPFNVTPDPKFLYLNARYREAIASLHYGITQRKGFITLIGEAGTGKTTLLKRLLEELDQNTRTVFLFNTNVTFEEILEYIFAEFDLPVHSGKKLYMLQRLNTFLLEELRQGRNVALLIDEAQDLEYSVLEDLRLLSNLETAKEKIIQIVLSGQPELGQKLSNPVLRQLRQRISVNCRLLPLSREEVSEYIHFRLEAAGAPDTKLFTRDAEEQIYHFSRGIPRLVNVVCDNALVIGYAMGKKRITADIIKEAAADLLPMESAAHVQTESTRESVSAPREPGNQAKSQSSWWQRFVYGGAVVAAAIAAWTAGQALWQAYRSTGAAPDGRATAPSEHAEVIRPGSVSAGESEPAIPAAEAEPPERGEMLPEHPEQAPALQVVEPAPRLAMLADEPTDVARPDALREARTGGALEVAGEGAAKAVPEAAAPSSGKASAAEQPHPEVATAPDFGRGQSPSGVVPQPVGQTALMTRGSEAGLPTAAERAGSAAAPVEGSGSPTGRLEVDLGRFTSMIVRPGDSLSSIARARYGQSSYTILDLIKLANPQVQDVDWILPGQSLRLPDLREGPPILRESAGKYSLLVFSTPNLPRAQALAAALRERGFSVEVRGAELGSQKKVFRVTVGGGPGREDATRVGMALQRVLREDPNILRLGL
jgi:type II secretory pathway predicted ATPase ExeA/nucleoid-associated protein YgaU